MQNVVSRFGWYDYKVKIDEEIRQQPQADNLHNKEQKVLEKSSSWQGLQKHQQRLCLI